MKRVLQKLVKNLYINIITNIAELSLEMKLSSICLITISINVIGDQVEYLLLKGEGAWYIKIPISSKINCLMKKKNEVRSRVESLPHWCIINLVYVPVFFPLNQFLWSVNKTKYFQETLLYLISCSAFRRLVTEKTDANPESAH